MIPMAVAVRHALAAWATWSTASSTALLSNGNQTMQGTSTSSYATVLAAAPVSTPTYVEMQLDLVAGSFVAGAGALAYSGTGALPDQFTGYAFDQTSVGAYPRTGDTGVTPSWYVYAQATAQFSALSVGSSPDPSYRVGVAINPTTRAVWLRLVWTSGATAWAGGGDPATGTTPTYTLAGTNPIYPAASAEKPSTGTCAATLIANPANFLGATPSGFTAGLSVTSQPMALTGTLPNATEGTAYHGTMALTGTYVAPVTITAAVGTIPAWMTPSASGSVVSFDGTPTTGAVSFTPRATDANAQTATGPAQSITVAPLTLAVTGAMGNKTVGDVLTGSYSASGGTAPYTYSYTGTLPAGMALSSAGARSGTLTTAATSDFVVTATDSASHSGTLSEHVVVSAAGGSTAPTVGVSASTNGTTTVGVTTAATGSSFAVVTGEYSPGTAIAAPTDNKGNTYTKIRELTFNSYRATLWLCTNGTGGAGHTWTDHDTKPYGTLTAVEIKGGATTSLIDVHNGLGTNGAGPWGSGSITTTNAADLVLGFAVYDFASSNNGITGVATGYTLAHDTPTGDDICSAVSSKALSATATESTTFTSSTASIGLVIIAAFKGA